MQVVVQPIFSAVETCASQRWPSSSFVNGKYPFRIGKMKFSLSFFRLVWRSIFVVLVTILGMTMPFSNERLTLLGSTGFYPLTIYFPVEMDIAKRRSKEEQ